MSWTQGLRNRIHLLVLLISLPVFLQAQTDSLTYLVFDQLKLNISNIDINPSSETAFNQQFSKPKFEEEYAKSEPKLFPDCIEAASIFYDQFNQLPLQEKQKLQTAFSVYEPIISAKLKEADLPDELKYLAPALSGMNTLAVGEYRKAGIWQLTHFQAILNGLQTDRLVDERFDIELASQAAASEIAKNMAVFKSVDLAVLAFISGKTKVLNALNNNSGKPILEQMPAKVIATIAAFQALKVFLQESDSINDPRLLKSKEVLVSREMHFKQIAEVLDVPIEQIQQLNPKFRYAIIPDGKNYFLNLPIDKTEVFQSQIDAIYGLYDSTYFEVVAQKIEYPPAPTRQYAGEKVKDLEIEGKTKIKYMIKTGDVLGFIAEDFDVRVADLKYWNNIYNERKIQAGQTIDIFVDDEELEYYSKISNSNFSTISGSKSTSTFAAAVPNYAIPESSKKIEHVVKNGESPYVIAKQYDGVTPEAILHWNDISDPRKIQIGQKLIIYLQQ